MDIKLNLSYYASIMLDAFRDLLCSKLCWHNRPGPVPVPTPEASGFNIQMSIVNGIGGCREKVSKVNGCEDFVIIFLFVGRELFWIMFILTGLLYIVVFHRDLSWDPYCLLFI